MPNDIKFEEGTEVQEDDQLLADILDDEIAVGEGTKTDEGNSDLDALKAKVEELESANAGLLKAKQAEVGKRQTLAEKQAQLEGAISAILSQRQQAGMESVTEAQAAGAKAQGIPVTYDDDGNGWIDPNYIQQLTSPYEQRINELEAKLQQTDAASSAAAQAQKVMEAIVGEDPSYGPASGRYRAARKWVEDQVISFSNENGVKRQLTSGEALDHVFSDPFVQKQFNDQFGNIDLVDVVTAEDSQAHYRRTLKNIASVLGPQELEMPKDKMDSRFQKVLNKPSTLGTNANAKAGQLSVLERVGSMGTEDIMGFSDAQIDALMKLVSKE